MESEQSPTDRKDTVIKNTADKPHKREVTLKAALEIDNFMLDGFDFSTGMDQCQIYWCSFMHSKKIS